MKNVIRLVLVLFVVAVFIDAKLVINDAYENLLIGYMLMSGSSMMIIFFYIFYHCKKASFVSIKSRKRWFTLLIIGIFFGGIGHLIYYIFVVELSVGLNKGKDIANERNT